MRLVVMMKMMKFRPFLRILGRSTILCLGESTTSLRIHRALSIGQQVCFTTSKDSDITPIESTLIAIQEPKKTKTRISMKDNPLLKYLLNDLHYIYKDLKQTIANEREFFDMKLERFKQLAIAVKRAGLSEKILWQYYPVFKVDDFASLEEKLETINYLQEMLEENDMKRYDIYVLVSMKKEEYLRKNAVIKEELNVKDESFIPAAFCNRIGMWLKSENDLRSILRLLKGEYGMGEDELRSWFTVGKSTQLLSEKMLKDGAERKLIFEDLYGAGCFEKKKSLRTSALDSPILLSLPVPRYYATIDRLMAILSYESPQQLKWIPASVLYSADLDRIEKRLEVTYKYVTNGKELKKGTGRNGQEERYKVERSRFEEKQKEWELKYPMDNPAGESQVTSGTEEGSDGSRSTKTKKIQSNSIDEERMYEDYVRWTRGEKSPLGRQNAYEDLVHRSLKEYGEKRLLDVLKGAELEEYGEWRKMMWEKLGRVGLRMEDVYRELWKESEGIELNHEDAMKCIQRGDALTCQISQPMQKLGMVSLYLGLRRSEVERFMKITGGLFSIEKKIFPRLLLFAPVIHRCLVRRSEPSSAQMHTAEVASDNKAEVLRECVEMYRDHPVRKALRSFVLQDIRAAVNLAEGRWKESIKKWESSADNNSFDALYRYARAESS